MSKLEFILIHGFQDRFVEELRKQRHDAEFWNEMKNKSYLSKEQVDKMKQICKTAVD